MTSQSISRVIISATRKPPDLVAIRYRSSVSLENDATTVSSQNAHRMKDSDENILHTNVEETEKQTRRSRERIWKNSV